MAANGIFFSAMSLIGLVLHELAANATRYGAWADEGGGRVQLDWQRQGGDVVLTWIETGGPASFGQKERFKFANELDKFIGQSH